MKNRKFPLPLVFLAGVVVLVSLPLLPYAGFSWAQTSPYTGGDLPEGIVDFYDRNAGFQTFLDDNGIVEVFAACNPVGDDVRCSSIARFGANRLSATEGFSRDFGLVEGWSVTVFYLGPDTFTGIDEIPDGGEVFQVNTFGPAGLVDDKLELVLVGGEIYFRSADYR